MCNLSQLRDGEADSLISRQNCNPTVWVREEQRKIDRVYIHLGNVFQSGPTCLHCNQFDNEKKKNLIVLLKMRNPSREFIFHFPPLSL